MALRNSSVFDFDHETKALIRKKIKKFFGDHAFTREDREDETQELALALWRRRCRLAGSAATLDTSVDRLTRNRLRRHRAAKRDSRRASSLHILVNDADGGPTELAHVIGPRERDNRHRRHPPSDLEQAELRIALADALDGLPPPLRALAEALMARSKQDAAKELAGHRSTVHRRCAELRNLLSPFDPGRL